MINRIKLGMKILMGYNLIIYNYWKDNEVILMINGKSINVENGYDYQLIHALDCKGGNNE